MTRAETIATISYALYGPELTAVETPIRDEEIPKLIGRQAHALAETVDRRIKGLKALASQSNLGCESIAIIAAPPSLRSVNWDRATFLYRGVNDRGMTLSHLESNHWIQASYAADHHIDPYVTSYHLQNLYLGFKPNLNDPRPRLIDTDVKPLGLWLSPVMTKKMRGWVVEDVLAAVDRQGYKHTAGLGLDFTAVRNPSPQYAPVTNIELGLGHGQKIILREQDGSKRIRHRLEMITHKRFADLNLSQIPGSLSDVLIRHDYQQRERALTLPDGRLVSQFINPHGLEASVEYYDDKFDLILPVDCHEICQELGIPYQQ